MNEKSSGSGRTGHLQKGYKNNKANQKTYSLPARSPARLLHQNVILGMINYEKKGRSYR